MAAAWTAGTRGATSHRPQPGGVRRRLRAAGRGEDPDAAGGDAPRLPVPGGQPALDRGHAAARFQGCLRVGRDGGLPVRVRRDRWRRGRLDVRVAGGGLRLRSRSPPVPAEVESVGAARDERAAAGGGGPRAVGGAGARDDGPAALDVPRTGGGPGGRVSSTLRWTRTRRRSQPRG